MKNITKHITFFYLPDRLQYVHRLLQEANDYPFPTNVFIHTNTSMDLNLNFEYTNGKIQIIVHNLERVNPYYLTWKCRDLLKAQKNDYDIFMYMEDDVLLKKEALWYWLRYKDEVINSEYNLGFFRIEVGKDGREYTTDLGYRREEGDSIKYHLTKTVDREDVSYVLNDKNPYCAFWIYDQKEFLRFVHSPYYDIGNIRGYGIRESSAIGLHGLETPWYKGTVIPLIHGNVHPDSRVYHLPNNYVDNEHNVWALQLWKHVFTPPGNEYN